MKLYDKKKIDWSNLLFDNKALFRLLLPIVVEQLLNSFMGMADTMMVSNVGSEAISAVSLVDSVNNLVIQAFSAMAIGGSIVCSQYIGKGDNKQANNAARQVIITVLAISISLMFICILGRERLLRFIFGEVDDGVMSGCLIYFLITVISYPFLSLYSAGAAFFRAGGNSRFPMAISIISNFINIFGNAIFIYSFKMGVAGAALATLISRIFYAVVIFYFLAKPRQIIVINNYLKIRPDMPLIKKILSVGIPSGIENGMFQFGKLAIQSTVSTLGTISIAAQAMTNMLEIVSGIIGIGVGMGLMTVVGQSIGASRQEEAKYYIVKLTKIAWVGILCSSLFVFCITKPITYIAGMEKAAADLCFEMIKVITIFKPLLWAFSFTIPNGLRAAGDVRFSMIVSSVSMWCCRVALAVVLIRMCNFGIIAVWIGMFTDWFARAIIFSARFMSGKWLKKRVI